MTRWGELDYLVFDMPPGTGDINISLGQEIKFNSAVIVTTPQRLSYIDVVKGIEMWDDLKVPTVSVIENMVHVHGYPGLSPGKADRREELHFWKRKHPYDQAAVRNQEQL
jgi:MinD-like ATPase involved in chromosome partitioning or flagellar assembly